MDIQRTEVLRYLGYAGHKIDHYTDRLIDECLQEIYDIAHPKYKIGVYDLEFHPGEIHVKS